MTRTARDLFRQLAHGWARTLRSLVLLASLGCSAAQPAPPAAPAPESHPDTIQIQVDATSALGPFPRVWNWFGYDEANYTYHRDGSQLLDDLAQLDGEPIYVRTHNLLTTREGEVDRKWGFTDVYSEDAEGRPRHDWTLVDRIFDTFVRLGIKPVVEIGFMPKALSTHPDP
jgi:xylan 1,4-beta-xylosidase